MTIFKDFISETAFAQQIDRHPATVERRRKNGSGPPFDASDLSCSRKKPTGRDLLPWYVKIEAGRAGFVGLAIGRHQAVGREDHGPRPRAEPLVLTFPELNAIMVFISTVLGWRFHSRGYAQAEIMREGKAARGTAAETALREAVKAEYRPKRRYKEIAYAVNQRLAGQFDEVSEDVVSHRIRKLKNGLL